MPRLCCVCSQPCAGFFACGATLANLLLSGVGQVLTAALTRCVLRRRLTTGQLAGIAFVSLGLAVRAAPAAYFEWGAASTAAAAAAGTAPGLALSQEQLVGAGLVSLAALLYSLLGVAYEKLLKGSEAPPPNAEIMWSVSILGGCPEASRTRLPRGALGSCRQGRRHTALHAWPPVSTVARPPCLFEKASLACCCGLSTGYPPAALPLPLPSGFLASAAYQLLYVAPRWETLVGRHLAASAASPRHVAALLAVFGAGFNLHMLAQVGSRGQVCWGGGQLLR